MLGWRVASASGDYESSAVGDALLCAKTLQ